MSETGNGSAPTALSRDSIRAEIFKSRPVERASLTFRGVKIELVAPTMGQMMRVRASAGEVVEAMTLYTLVEIAVIPGTDVKVFDEADISSLSAMPSADINDIAGSLLILMRMDKKVAEASKNLSATPSATTLT